MQECHRGGPCLSCTDVCTECLKQALQGLVSNQDLVGLREQLLAALDDDEANQELLACDPTSLYVSRTWVVGFKRRSGIGSSGRLDPPTAGECHDDLTRPDKCCPQADSTACVDM